MIIHLQLYNLNNKNKKNLQQINHLALMKIPRPRKQSPQVKLPLIKDKINFINPIALNKNVKLEKIGKMRNIGLIDLSKIDKIEKQFTVITKRNDQERKQHKALQTKDQMRQSKLLLLKNITPHPVKKQNQNLLSSLVQYQKPSIKQKQIMIPPSNISVSPTKKLKVQSSKKNKEKFLTSQYNHPEQIQKIDFVKMFIVEQLLFYISKLHEKVKQQMTGFCKFYNENFEQETIHIISETLVRQKDYLTSVFYQKIGFYIFLILGTDNQLQQQAHFLLDSLTQYIHKNNLIILDMLMQIADIQKFPISSQFHVYNTSRFNQDRRRIKHNQDRMNLIAKNNKAIEELIRSILTNCGFDSLKTFVNEILSNQDVQLPQKIKQVSMMLISLDTILTNSVHQTVQRPKPPFLSPNIQRGRKYTLVLDMDQTLIHYRQIQGRETNGFLTRPFCHQFLDQMEKHYEIVIFTAAVKQYADSILDNIDQKKRISHRLYRQHTRLQDYVSIKDLSTLNRDLSKCIIVDNIASNFKLQPRNGIAISTWTGEQDDIALSNLIPVLKKLVVENVNDVRDGLEALSQYMQKQIVKGQQIKFDQITLKGL